MIPTHGTLPGAAGGGRRRVRRVLLALVVLLFIVSVPWYRESGGEVTVVFGLPDWVAVALGCYVGVAVLNCVAWLLTDVRDPGSPPAQMDPEHVGPEPGA